MSETLSTILDHLRLLGRKARPEDLRDGDLVLVKHINQEGFRLEGIFGQVRAEVEVVGKRKKQHELIKHYVADQLLGEEDQLTFFKDELQTNIEDQLMYLVRQLVESGAIELVDEVQPSRFFTGEICIFQDPEQGYIRVEEYRASSTQIEQLRSSNFVRVVRDVVPLTDRERERMRIN
jgi:hypothetical protein